MRILVVDDTDVVRQIVVTVLERQFKVTVVEASSGNEAIDALKADPSFDCIVCDYTMPNGSGGDVYNYIQSAKLNIPYIHCSTEKVEDCVEFKDQEIFGSVEKSTIMPSLTKLMGSFLKNLEFQANALTHCRVRFAVLRKVNVVNCDLYLKISESKYVRIINSNELVDEELLQKYEDKKVDSFYIRHADSSAFLDGLLQSIISLEGLAKVAIPNQEILKITDKIQDLELKKNILELSENIQNAKKKNPILPEAYRISEWAQEQVQQAVSDLGMSEELQFLVKTNVQFTLQTLTKNPTFAEIFESSGAEKDRFLISHSTVLAYVSCSIASMMGWNSDFTRYKLSLASFMHDICLGKFSFAKLESLEELLLNKDEFSEAEIDTFLSHPQESFRMVREMRDLPPDVDQMVLQHHERPNGTGFPNRLDHTKLGPLSCIFIMAHDLVAYVFDRGTQAWSFKEFLKNSGATYEQGHFKKIKKRILESK